MRPPHQGPGSRSANPASMRTGWWLRRFSAQVTPVSSICRVPVRRGSPATGSPGWPARSGTVAARAAGTGSRLRPRHPRLIFTSPPGRDPVTGRSDRPRGKLRLQPGNRVSDLLFGRCPAVGDEVPAGVVPGQVAERDGHPVQVPPVAGDPPIRAAHEDPGHVVRIAHRFFRAATPEGCRRSGSSSPLS
jgi:hypothetical protein